MNTHPDVSQNIYWLHSPIPVDELDGRNIRVTIIGAEANTTRVFTLQALAHPFLPHIHQITANCDGRTIHPVCFDQYLANRIRRSMVEPLKYQYEVELDAMRKPERVIELDHQVHDFNSMH